MNTNRSFPVSTRMLSKGASHKPFLIWIACALFFAAPTTLLAAPPGPPEAVEVEVVNTPLPVTGDIDAIVTGEVSVNNLPLVQEVSGDVNATVTGNVNAAVTGEISVSNFPSVQQVNGDVNASVTGEVSVGNFPLVQEVSGDVNAVVTGEVNIANTPDVNVANTPLDVVVTNGNPAREPYQVNKSTLEPGGGFAEVEFTALPVGKLFEIQHVSSFTVLEIGSWMYCTLQVVEPDPDTVVAQHHIIITQQNGTFNDLYTASTPITLFAESGQKVEYECGFSSQSDSVLLQVSLSGYLIDN